MSGPTHDPNTCAQKGGRWECLHAIDADHFWLGDLMVDLVLLRYEVNSLNAKEQNNWSWDIHERCRVLGNLNRIAEYLATGKYKEKWAKWAGYVKCDLLYANKHGLHTGYRESPTERER